MTRDYDFETNFRRLRRHVDDVEKEVNSLKSQMEEVKYLLRQLLDAEDTKRIIAVPKSEVATTENPKPSKPGR